jgi:hypothetical protein
MSPSTHQSFRGTGELHLSRTSHKAGVLFHSLGEYQTLSLGACLQLSLGRRDNLAAVLLRVFGQGKSIWGNL